MLLACVAVTPITFFVIYKYLKSQYPHEVCSWKEMKWVIIVLCWIIPYVAFLPLSTGLYLTLSGYWQFGLVMVQGGFRWVIICGIEYLGENRVSQLTILVFELVCDMFYETHAASQMAAADLGITLACQPVMDLLGNCWTMYYILRFAKDNKKAQTLMLIALSVREVVELVTSLGVSLVLGCAWFTHYEDFFMIDTLTAEQLQRAIKMSALDFSTEFLVLYIFSKLVQKVWGLTVLDLAQSFCAAIGRLEFFGLVAGCTTFILMFLQYHFGTDYFFQFLWLQEGMSNNSTFCEVLQDAGKSCFQTKLCLNI